MLPDKPNESDTDRDGFLSYAAEFHALSIGIYHGLVDSLQSTRPLPDNKDVEKEPHYYASGYVLGTLIQLGGLITLSLFGVSAL